VDRHLRRDAGHPQSEFGEAFGVDQDAAQPATARKGSADLAQVNETGG
jgi:hypothetical protein